MPLIKKKTAKQKLVSKKSEELANLFVLILKNFKDRMDLMDKNEKWIKKNIKRKNRSSVELNTKNLGKLSRILTEEKKIVKNLKLEETDEKDMISRTIKFLKINIERMNSDYKTEFQKALYKLGYASYDNFVNACEYAIVILEKASQESVFALSRIHEEEVMIEHKNNVHDFLAAWEYELLTHKELRVMLTKFKEYNRPLNQKVHLTIAAGIAGVIMGKLVGLFTHELSAELIKLMNMDDEHTSKLMPVAFALIMIITTLSVLGTQYIKSKQKELTGRNLISKLSHGNPEIFIQKG